MTEIYKRTKGDTSGKSNKEKMKEQYLKTRKKWRDRALTKKAKDITSGKSKQNITDVLRETRKSNINIKQGLDRKFKDQKYKKLKTTNTMPHGMKSTSKMVKGKSVPKIKPKKKLKTNYKGK